MVVDGGSVMVKVVGVEGGGEGEGGGDSGDGDACT